MSHPTVHSFRAMHETGLLRLANAWDAGSARLIESLGARAVATTSAGMAWAAGYGDGNRMPRELVLSLARAVARVVTVPLTVDIEAGYSSNPNDVGEFAVRLAESGVVGINIEDGTESPDLLARKVEALKGALSRAGLDIFVNARTDVYLAALVEPPARLDEVLRRATMYEAAGADGLFVPFVVALPEIRAITRACALPLNVLACEGLPAADALVDAGARRLSAGSGLATRVWRHAEIAARQFLDEGTLAGTPKAYGDLQRLFA